MTLDELIAERSKLSPEDEAKAWVADKRRAERVYLETIRMCDERMMAAVQRTNLSE